MPRQLDGLEPCQEDQLGPRGNTSVAQQKFGGGYEKTLDFRLVRQQSPFVESVYDHWNLALMERGYGIAFVGGLQIGQQGAERSGRNGDFSQVEDRRLKCRRQCLANVLLPTAADASMKMISFRMTDGSFPGISSLGATNGLGGSAMKRRPVWPTLGKWTGRLNTLTSTFRAIPTSMISSGEGRTFYNSGASGSMGSGFAID